MYEVHVQRKSEVKLVLYAIYIQISLYNVVVLNSIGDACSNGYFFAGIYMYKHLSHSYISSFVYSKINAAFV